MSFLKFSRTPKPQRFEYRPRFYDPETEKYKQRRKSRQTGGAEGDEHEARKARIAGSFRRRKAVEKRTASKQKRRSNTIVILVLVALLAVTAYFIEQYLPTLLRIIE